MTRTDALHDSAYRNFTKLDFSEQSFLVYRQINVFLEQHSETEGVADLCEDLKDSLFALEDLIEVDS